MMVRERAENCSSNYICFVHSSNNYVSSMVLNAEENLVIQQNLCFCGKEHIGKYIYISGSNKCNKEKKAAYGNRKKRRG